MVIENRINYAIIGACVVTLFSLFTLAILWLSSGFSFEGYSTYLVYMQESVSGLNVDSQVEYNGVEVGLVKSIELNHKNPRLVELFLSIKNSTPLTRGTVASLATRGLTGLVYVALKDDSTDLRPLVADAGQPYPVIPSSPSIFVRLDTALTQISASFTKISETVQAVLSKDNVEALKEIFYGLEQVINTLATNSKNISAIIENTGMATGQLGPMMQSGRATMRMLETQTLPATYELLSKFDEITRSVSELTNQVKQNPSVVIRGSAPDAPGPGEGN